MTFVFKKEFKESILNGTKNATIRNTKHYNEGTVFKLNLGSRFKPEEIAKGRCVESVKISVEFLLEVLEFGMKKNVDDNYLVISFTELKNLGFSTPKEAFDFYKGYLKNKYCYYHRFELIKD